MSVSSRTILISSVATVCLLCVGAAIDPGLHTIPLSRRSVPVTRNGKVISHKTIYAGDVQVGIPLQSFRVVFDTGSGHVVLPSVECETQQCTIKNRYNEAKTRTGHSINIDKSIVNVGELLDEVTVTYGTGEIVGDIVREHVCIGTPAEAKGNVSCAYMGFIKATELSYSPFFVVPVDGIFGLGLASLALDPEFSFFHMLVQSGKLPLPQFSMYIGEGDEESELTLGGHNPSHLDSPLHWAPVAMAEHGHWIVDIVAVHIGNHTLDLCKDGSCRAIVDTGTSHVGVPADSKQLVDKMLTQFAGGLENCRDVEAPSISFEINGYNLTLGPQNYMRPLPVEGLVNPPAIGNNTNGTQNSTSQNLSLQSNLVSNGHADVNTTFCKALIMPIKLPDPLGPNMFILGEPFFRRYLTVFDWAQPSMGFGLAADKPIIQTEDTLIFMQSSTEKDKAGNQFNFVQLVIVSKAKTKLKVKKSPQMKLLG